MNSLRILPDAEAELLHEIAYYSKMRLGTGVRFNSAIEATLELILRHPLGGAPSPFGTRSFLVKGFPFSVIYRVTAEELLVVAIAAHRRKPGYWAQRVEGH